MKYTMGYYSATDKDKHTEISHYTSNYEFAEHPKNICLLTKSTSNLERFIYGNTKHKT